MHKIPTQKMEEEANAFAGALLMPSKDIRSYFAASTIDLRRLAALKLEWKMAMAALHYRAKELGYLSETQSRYIWQQFSIHKIKMKEPPELDFAPERPSVMPKVIQAHLQSLGYSMGEFSRLLKMTESELTDFYNLNDINPSAPTPRPPLRIVT
jgi:Zn-dependent peptidase ImmA (M78 family)